VQPGDDDAPRVDLALVRPMVRGLARLGISREEFSKSLHARDGKVSIARLAQAFDEVATRTRTPHLALELVRALPLGALGASDYCFSTSATLIEALARIASHVVLFTEDLQYELSVDGDTARIETTNRFPPLYIFNELASCFVVRRLRDVLGDDAVTLTGVRFKHHARGPLEPYEAYFGVPVEFGAAAYDVTFPRRLLKAPLLTADAELANMLSAHPSIPAVVGAAPSLPERVRENLTHSMVDREGPLPVNRLARRMGMSSRSLQRKLKDEGSSYLVLLDEARCELAKKLLAREGVLLMSVAGRLGFNDLTAFFRAFRRWTGKSPRAFQAVQRGQARP
jgi:AraC-like DNA-binding protein